MFYSIYLLNFDKNLVLTQERAVPLKNGTKDFQNSPPFERLACFYGTITGNFEHFQYLNFETSFLKNENPLQKTGEPFFS